MGGRASHVKSAGRGRCQKTWSGETEYKRTPCEQYKWHEMVLPEQIVRATRSVKGPGLDALAGEEERGHVKRGGGRETQGRLMIEDHSDEGKKAGGTLFGVTRKKKRPTYQRRTWIVLQRLGGRRDGGRKRGERMLRPRTPNLTEKDPLFEEGVCGGSKT